MTVESFSVKLIYVNGIRNLMVINMLKIFITTFTKKLNNYKNHFASLAWRHLVKTSEKKNIYILFRNPH